MEDALLIFDYLPYLPNDPNELNYVINLKESFELNYSAGKYHFAFIAYHMLFMSFVYYEIWQIREKRKDEFGFAMIGFDRDHEKHMNDNKRAFSLHRINESGVFGFFRLIGCPDDKIGNYKKIVKLRNEAAHVNGSMRFLNSTSIDETINDILKNVQSIQKFTIPIVEKCFKAFLEENWNPENWISDQTQQINEVLVRDNYLSLEDIRHLCKIDLKEFATHPKYKEIICLNEGFKKLYSED